MSERRKTLSLGIAGVKNMPHGDKIERQYTRHSLSNDSACGDMGASKFRHQESAMRTLGAAHYDIDASALPVLVSREHAKPAGMANANPGRSKKQLSNGIRRAEVVIRKRKISS